MKALFNNLRDALQTFGFLKRRVPEGPLDSVAELCNFVETRSAFVAQKTMYGYIQTRMGMQYPVMFQDKDFVQSMNIAKMHIFASCLADLTIFAVAEATSRSAMKDDERAALAAHCYRKAIEAQEAHAPSATWAEDAMLDFSDRLRGAGWDGMALSAENFRRSPLALIKWSPIAPELKKHDAEIVENSMRFAWIEVREDFRRRIDREAFEGG